MQKAYMWWKDKGDRSKVRKKAVLLTSMGTKRGVALLLTPLAPLQTCYLFNSTAYPQRVPLPLPWRKRTAFFHLYTPNVAKAS